MIFNTQAWTYLKEAYDPLTLMKAKLLIWHWDWLVWEEHQLMPVTCV